MITPNKFKALQKKLDMQKLHSTASGRLKIDTNYQAPEIRQTDMRPAIPYNEVEQKEVLSSIKVPTLPVDSTKNEADFQDTRANLLKPIELLQIDLLKQILAELKKLNAK
jgi:hypothetical protein